MTLKNEVFGLLLYAPASKRCPSPLYAFEPDADDAIVMKNDVLGLLLYAPDNGFKDSARYTMDPEAYD